jgi:signal recognition particle subunit SRP54
MLDNLTRRLGSVFAGLSKQGRLKEEDVKAALREVRVALLEADVNFRVAKQFIKEVEEKAVGEEIYGVLNAEQTLIKIVRDQLVELLGEDVDFNFGGKPPTVILLCGLQGAGKTTAASKLAHWLKKKGKKTMLAACDLQRPGAVKQLQVLAERVGCEFYSDESAGPVNAAKGALERARHLFMDVLIVDTAGRLSIDEALMDELAQVRDAVQPTETLLVLDAAVGQEAVNVAEAFHSRFSLTGLIFSKMDGDTRGGAILSVRSVTGVPVRFLGTGELPEAMDAFNARRVAERIIGMGDVMGLIEKAEEAVNMEEAAGLQEKMSTGRMDFNDMLTQMRMVRRMGPLKNVMKMIPGFSQAVSEEDLDAVDAEGKMKSVEAIVLSMTPAERSNPDILNGSRRRRIARGSGTRPEDVNQLVDQLYEMRRQMKQLSKLQQRMGKRGRGRRR